jgi:hypothetical protein
MASLFGSGGGFSSFLSSGLEALRRMEETKQAEYRSQAPFIAHKATSFFDNAPSC